MSAAERELRRSSRAAWAVLASGVAWAIVLFSDPVYPIVYGGVTLGVVLLAAGPLVVAWRVYGRLRHGRPVVRASFDSLAPGGDR